MSDHYKVHAYVCGASCVRYPEFEGFATFGTIFQQRPDGCRYVVVERPAERDFVVWDMFDTQLAVRALTTILNQVLTPPTPVWAAADADTLVMKAIALMTGISDEDDWMTKVLVQTMVDVRFYIDGEFYCEPQVDDPETLHEVIEIRLRAYRCSSAIYPYRGRWVLYRPHHKNFRRRLVYFDALSAAEMVVIHGK